MIGLFFLAMVVPPDFNGGSFLRLSHLSTQRGTGQVSAFSVQTNKYSKYLSKKRKSGACEAPPILFLLIAATERSNYAAAAISKPASPAFPPLK